jgi:hypothetical protein
MATIWDEILEAEGLPQSEDPDSLDSVEIYDELHANGEMESEYFEFLSSTRRLPSAQWGLDSSRDPAQRPEWD